MDQKTIDTRQRAAELLEDAVRIWRQSNRNDYLEGLENDPVFALLMTAVAYQANETDDEIERMKNDVLEEYVSALLPYEDSHPVPATACISVQPSHGVPEVLLDSSSVFTLSGTEFSFIPVLRSRVLPVHVSAMTRLDGRRWRVKLAFDYPVSDISSFCFAVRNHSYRDLKLFIGNEELPLIRPWEFSQMPYSSIFSLDHSIYNGAELYDPSSSVMDMFATQNIRLYCIPESCGRRFIKDETNELDLVFEFIGTTPDFNFEHAQISLNPVILANVSVNTVSLDSQMPFIRVGDVDGRITPNSKLMYVLKPSSSQTNAGEKVRVRRVSAERFTSASLIKLLSSLLNKVQSDYFAFRDLPAKGAVEALENIREQLDRLKAMTADTVKANTRGTYIMLKNPFSGVGLRIEYLTTSGAAVNTSLNARSIFVTPAGLSQSGFELIGAPEPGMDQTDATVDPETRIRYSIQTGNRLVTPSDVKIFCKKELLSRYGISGDLLRSVWVGNRLQEKFEIGGNASGYAITVNIEIADTGFVRRSFVDRIPQAEMILEKMIEVRSTAVYPVKVSIRTV